jgi:hypothetical protein
MAGESAHFGLRERPPTPAVRPFDLPPRMMPMSVLTQVLEAAGKIG